MIKDSKGLHKQLLIGGAVAIVGILLASWGIYMNAVKRDSYLWAVIIGSILTLAGIGVGIFLYLKFRNSWHESVNNANDALKKQGVTVALAPRAATLKDKKDHDHWRRISTILQRNGDYPAEHVSWEIIGDRDRAVFVLRTTEVTLRAISGELDREYPGIEIIPLPDNRDDVTIHNFVDPLADTQFPDPITNEDRTLVWQELTLARNSAYPIFSSNDPQGRLLAVLSAVSVVNPAARVGFQFLIRKADPNIASKWLKETQKLVPKPTQSNPRPQIAPETKSLIQLIQSRANEPIFELCIRCWAASTNKEVAENELKRIVNALEAETLAAGQANQLIPKGQPQGDVQPLLDRSFPFESKVHIVASELGEFLHLPGKTVAEPYPRLVTASAKRLPPHPSLVLRPGSDPSEYRSLGEYDYPTGDVAIVGQPVIDTNKHSYVIGPTGTGKSVTMVNMIIHDFLDEQASVLAIEPSGDVPGEIVRGLPPDKLNDMIILEPGDIQPFALNMCTVGLSGGPMAAVKNALTAIRKDMGASWETAVRMRQVLENGLIAVIDVLSRQGDTEPSLAALFRFLQNPDYRAVIVPNCSMQALPAKEFWLSDFATWSEREQADAITIVMRRLTGWMSNLAIRRSLSMPYSTINLSELLGNRLDDPFPRKLIVLPLYNGEVKALVGALFTSNFLWMVMNRHSIPKDMRSPVKLYIDEFPDFVNTSGADDIKIMLAQARKFRAAVTLLAQGQEQIPKDVQVELRINTLTKIFLTMSDPQEARMASTQMAGAVSDYDLMRVPKYHAYVKVGQYPPTLLRMPPPAHYKGKQPPLKRSFAVQPPAGWKSLVQEQEPYNRFVKNTEFTVPESAENLTATDLLRWTYHQAQTLKGEPDQFIQTLVDLGDDDFQALTETRREFDRWRAKEVEENPSLIPDPLERVRWRSRWLYGIPWWLSDAQYMRMAKEAAEASSPDDSLGGLELEVSSDDWW